VTRIAKQFWQTIMYDHLESTIGTVNYSGILQWWWWCVVFFFFFFFFFFVG
jgi:hypothetical protein